MASGMRNWLEFKKRRVIRDKLLGFLLQSAYALVATGAAVTLVFGATLFMWMGNATVALSVVGLQFVLYPIFGKRLRYSASDGVFKVVLGLLFIPSSLAESAIGELRSAWRFKALDKDAAAIALQPAWDTDRAISLESMMENLPETDVLQLAEQLAEIPGVHLLNEPPAITISEELYPEIGSYMQESGG